MAEYCHLYPFWSHPSENMTCCMITVQKNPPVSIHTQRTLVTRCIKSKTSVEVSSCRWQHRFFRPPHTQSSTSTVPSPSSGSLVTQITDPSACSLLGGGSRGTENGSVSAAFSWWLMREVRLQWFMWDLLRSWFENTSLGLTLGCSSVCAPCWLWIHQG